MTLRLAARLVALLAVGLPVGFAVAIGTAVLSHDSAASREDLATIRAGGRSRG